MIDRARGFVGLALGVSLTLAACVPAAALLSDAPAHTDAHEDNDAGASPIELSVLDGGEAWAPAPPAPPWLEGRLASWPGALVRGTHGELISIFGFSPDGAREILSPVSRQRSLPVDYRPRDLVGVPGPRRGALVRAVALQDLKALLEAAHRADLRLAPISGFRSYAAQSALFERRVQDRLAAEGWAISVEEARERANVGIALPGHSQHQLGTALDFSTPELGYLISRTFAQTPAGLWLREHAWEFGFVFPYTEEGRQRTGFIAEPWHLRWVGRPLAAFLRSEGYLDTGDVVVDDYLEALERLLDEPACCADLPGSQPRTP